MFSRMSDEVKEAVSDRGKSRLRAVRVTVNDEHSEEERWAVLVSRDSREVSPSSGCFSSSFLSTLISL